VTESSARRSSSRDGLWRNRDFRHLWMGDTVSVFGTQFAAFGMPLMAVQLLHADAFEMGILAALESAAFLLISLPAGAWVDRSRKKLIIVVGNLARAALLLTLPIAWLWGHLTLFQLYAVAGLVGVISVFFDVANQSYLPEIVDSKRIADGNGKLQASYQSAEAVGPTVASVLAGWIGSPLTIAITSACMALASLFVGGIRHREVPRAPEERKPMVAEIGEGLRFVLTHKLLVKIVACTGAGNLASSAIFGIFVLYALRTLDLTAFELGVVMSVSALGGIVGAVTSGRVQGFVGEGRVIPITAVLSGVAFLSMPLASVLPAIPTLIVGGFLISWSLVIYNITQVSFRQRLCPKPLLGRMNASVRFLVWGPMPIGALLGGVAGRAIGVVPTMWIFAGVAVLAAAPVILSPLMHMRELPREMDALSDPVSEQS
jgi:Na+/melibiose symporter-like transporter